MKILIDGHMIGQNEGGNERYTKNLAISLSTIASVGLLVYKKSKLPSSVKQITVPPVDFFRIITLPYILLRYGYDILHTNYLLPLLKPPGKKYIVTVHDVYFRRAPKTYSLKDRLLFFVFLPYSLWLADAVVVPSEFTRKEFVLFYPRYADKVFVTGEGVDPVFHPRAVKRRPFYLAVSSKSARKNIPVLCETFQKSSMKNMSLYIVGNVSPHPLPAHPRIKYLGYVSDKSLNTLYNETYALIYLSSYEGFGLPPLEALSCNTPVIASSIPCIREVCGSRVTYVKHDELAIVFTRKIKAPDRALPAKYTWKNAAEKTIDAYRWSLNGKEASRRRK